MVARFVLRALPVVALLTSAGAWSLEPMGARPHLAPDYSKCLLSRYPAFTVQWLKTLAGTDEEVALIQRNQAGIDACFGINSDGSRYFQSYDFEGIRAAIVRYLLQSKRDAMPQQPPVGLENVQWYSSIADVTAQRNAAAVLTNEMSFCVAKSNWQGVRAIVHAVNVKMERRILMPKKVQERELSQVNAELNRMVPSISACLPAGFTFALDRTKLRRVLEEAAFHAMDDGMTFEALSKSRTGAKDA